MSKPDRRAEIQQVQLPTDTLSQTPFDYNQAAVMELTPAQATQFERSGERMAAAIRDIFNSEQPIDYLEFGCYHLEDRNLIFLSPSSYKIQDTYQADLSVSADNGYGEPEPLQTVVNILEDPIPDWLDIYTGSIPVAGFKPSSPAITFRLVMDDGRKLSTGVNGVGLSTLLEDLRNEPFLYHAIIRHRPENCPENFEYQLTVRIVLFGTRHQLQSKKDIATMVENGFPIDPAASFEELGVTSSLEAFRNLLYRDWYDPSIIKFKSEGPLDGGNLHSIQNLVTGKDQFRDLFRGRYGAPNEYDAICDYDRILARETDLGAFIDLDAVSQDVDPFDGVPGRTVLTLDQLQAGPASVTPDPVSVTTNVDQDDDIATLDRQTANDGTEHHFEAIKTVAQYFREQGCAVHIVRQQGDSQPDLWIKTEAGDIYAVEVETKNKSRPANVYTNITRAALWGYPTIVVMAPDEDHGETPPPSEEIASWVINKLAFCMKETTETGAKLHTMSKTASIDGQPVLLPKGMTESDWQIDWEGTLSLMNDGTVLASGPTMEPVESFFDELPRLEKTNGEYIVRDSNGNVLNRYKTKEDFKKDWTKVNLPFVPVDLTYVHFVESLYVLQDEELTEFPIRAEWNECQPADRHEQSLEAAFSTFLVDLEEGGEVAEDDDEITRIWEHEFRAFVGKWITNLSDHEPPHKNVYGTHRKKFTERHSKNQETGKQHFYRNLAYRFPRGIVAPHLPGLDDRPRFPDDWELDSGQAVREPLVYDLSGLGELEDDDELVVT
ncbi:hypothetical protein [Natrialba sp. INN-245]|uniref:hypothetical protein n=1 Tax=Natrialba sp. INN-245 TaxID=2690967 RepID=UPI0013103297|nr:hypothetical protein [Natrialba sp. INN-245]MWV40072.1 hypothetical protein [Natrialba sp. INN-245]